MSAKINSMKNFLFYLSILVFCCCKNNKLQGPNPNIIILPDSIDYRLSNQVAIQLAPTIYAIKSSPYSCIQVMPYFDDYHSPTFANALENGHQVVDLLISMGIDSAKLDLRLKRDPELGFRYKFSKKYSRILLRID